MSRGWDFLQFRTEEPDETSKNRKIDLVPAPKGVTIWIEGTEYSQYVALLPIECKRLPTPTGPTRDEREYLYNAHSSTGGVQRFKAGHHGAAHSMGAMIAYIQDYDIDFWRQKIKSWLNGLIAARISSWGEGDTLYIARRDLQQGTAVLNSVHCRDGKLPAIQLHHLWIEMTCAPVQA